MDHVHIHIHVQERFGLARPANRAELDALATALTTGDPDGNGKADTCGHVVPGATKRGYPDWYFSGFLWSAGGDYFSGGTGSLRPTTADEASVTAAQWLKDQFCSARSVVPGGPTARQRRHRPYAGRPGGRGAVDCPAGSPPGSSSPRPCCSSRCSGSCRWGGRSR